MIKVKKLFPEMTDKMKMLFMDIIASLGQLPDEIRYYLFDDGDGPDMEWVVGVAGYIALEYIKNAFDCQDPEYPLSHFFNAEDDSERMTQSRTMQYVTKYKKRELAEAGMPIPSDHKYANLDMDTISQKLKGHRLTEMNFFEHQNIHELELIKAIVENRIISSKKVSNARFQDMFEQYDEMVKGLIERSKESDEDMVFASLAFFTFEWHYPVETYYYIACIMEEEGIQNIDRETLILLCSRVGIESRFGGWFNVESRMVRERFFVLDYLFNGRVDPVNRQVMIDMIKEILVLVTKYKECVESKEGELYKDWFRQQSTTKDWASFFRWYHIFDIWEPKEWSRTRIQNMRKLIEATFRPAI